MKALRGLFLGLGCLLLSAEGLKAEFNPALPKGLSQIVIEGKKKLAVGLGQILALTVERATGYKISSIETKQALRDWQEQQAMNPLTWSNQVVNTRSGNLLSSSFVSSKASGLPYSRNDSVIASTGFSQKAKWGLSYGLTYQRASRKGFIAYFTSPDQPLSKFIALDDAYIADSWIAEMKLPLLKDFGSIGYLPEYRGEALFIQAQHREQKANRALLRQVGGAYWDLVAAQKNIQVRASAKELANRVLKEAETKFRLGALDPTEVTQAKTQLALAEQELLTEITKKRLIEDQIKVFLDLRNLKLEYWAKEEPQIKPLPLPEDKLLARALQQDPDLALLRAGISLNELDLQEANNADSSNLDLSLKYQQNGYGTFASEAARGVSKQGAVDYQVALTWQVPLFNHQGQRKRIKAELEGERIILQLENQKAVTEVNFYSLLQTLRLNEEAIRLAQTGVRLNEELYGKASARFKVGQSTSFRVALAQQDLAEAQMRLNQALIAYEKTFLDLLLMTDQVFNLYPLSS